MMSVDLRHSQRTLEPLREDEVIFSFLKASAVHLSPKHRQILGTVRDNSSYEERLACREICRSMGHLGHFTSRSWFRVLLDEDQLKFVRLGHESSNNFSSFFSKGTYQPGVAAHSIRSRDPLNGKREAHRCKVLKFAETISPENIGDVILCASRFTFNRQLKILDGNHRIIALTLKFGRLMPFNCIVGFSNPLYLSYLQRSLLGFPFFADTGDAIGFAVSQKLRQVRALVSGGENYQPLLSSGEQLREIATASDENPEVEAASTARSERPCVDRARLLRDDLRSTIGELEQATLLDIGCNIGFFCHFFAALGMRATGIENGQHNRHQRFSFSNSVDVAQQMNRRYGLNCDFVEQDARQWVSARTERFDAVLLLSVLHHFFIGYPMGDYTHEPLEEARRFLEQVARITDRVLYIEHENAGSTVSSEELIAYLRGRKLFHTVETIGRSADFSRPVIRCVK